MSNTPSDEEILVLAQQHLKAFAQFRLGEVWFEGEVEFARAVLEKWGTPQPAPAPLSEREAFERDWEKRHAPAPINGRTRDDGRYGDSSIQDAWESWQARAALATQGGE